MPISKLAHFSVRTTDLVASRRFYSGILGFKEGFRPPFKFPGAWMYLGGDEADHGVVHLIAIDENDPQGLIEYLGDKDCPRRSKSEPPCRLNIEPGVGADFCGVGCG